PLHPQDERLPLGTKRTKHQGPTSGRTLGGQGELRAAVYLVRTQLETEPAYHSLSAGYQGPSLAQRMSDFFSAPSTVYLHFTLKRALGRLSPERAGCDQRPAAANWMRFVVV